MKAWEAIQDLELITPVDKGVTKVQKEFRLFTLQVLPDQILAVVDANAPLTVKEWATRWETYPEFTSFSEAFISLYFYSSFTVSISTFLQ